MDRTKDRVMEPVSIRRIDRSRSSEEVRGVKVSLQSHCH